MSYIENEYNKRFNKETLSDGNFDEDDLWDAITEDLDQKTVVASRSTKGKWWNKGVLFLLLAGLVSGLFYMYSNSLTLSLEQQGNQVDRSIASNQNAIDSALVVSGERKTDNSKIANSSMMPSEKKAIERSNTSLVKGTNDTKTNTFDETINQIATSKKNKLNVDSTSKNPTKKIAIVTEIVGELLTNSITNNEIRTTVDYENIAVETSSLSSDSTVFIANHTNELSITGDIETSNPELVTIDESVNNGLISLALIPASILVSPISLPSLKLLQNDSTKEPEQQATLWKIGAFSGINTTYFNYQSTSGSDLAMSKQMAEKPFIGTSYGVNIGLQLNDFWQINSGIRSHQLWSEFDFQQKKNLQVLKENQLLKIWVSESTGDTLNQLYGDTIINTTSTRNVLHFNNYKRWSIPLEVGFQKNSRNFIYGISAGASFNFTVKQSGKTIDHTNEIIDFENGDTAATYKKFDVGLQVSPILGYHLTENLALSIQPQWMWLQKANFDETDIKIGVHQLNLNIGLEYYFR